MKPGHKRRQRTEARIFGTVRFFMQELLEFESVNPGRTERGRAQSNQMCHPRSHCRSGLESDAPCTETEGRRGRNLSSKNSGGVFAAKHLNTTSGESDCAVGLGSDSFVVGDHHDCQLLIFIE